ncbi:class 1 fructose-bisphosphatase [Rhodopila sp.]|uniref:class 1 fructose-bisphosphatase n=1 Tax=Rhodopila sp. TaxID=2480087 RepID=UPI003D107A4E
MIDRQAVVQTIAAIASGAAELATVIARGPLAGDVGRILGASADGDGQKALDLYANDVFTNHLRIAGVAAVASEEMADVVELTSGGLIAVAIDPLDGSNNVDVNAPMGTVFSLLPATASDQPENSFLAPGFQQLAAGFVLYGPHTALVLTLGDGVDIFTLDPRTRAFTRTCTTLCVPAGRREYAINASNGRHWPLPIRCFVEECVAGAEGPRGVDYNTRWLGAVVSEAYRILLHGGIYLYPGDTRPGYRRGRLRLLYEANPIALLLEQAGGAATDGFGRILDLVPADIHEHVPLIFGSRDKVERVMELYAASVPQAGQRPLFAVRGLFRS